MNTDDYSSILELLNLRLKATRKLALNDSIPNIKLEVGYSHLLIANINNKFAFYDLALQGYIKALEIMRYTLGSDNISLIGPLTRLAHINYTQNQYELALTCYQRIKEIQQDNPLFNHAIIDTFRNIARVQEKIRTKDTQSPFRSKVSAHNIQSKENDQTTFSGSSDTEKLSSCSSTSGSPDSSESLITEDGKEPYRPLENYKIISDLTPDINALSQIANIYYAQEEYNLALDRYAEILELTQDDKIIIVDVLDKIADIYYAKEEYDLALDMYDDILELTQDDKIIIVVLGKIARIYRLTNELKLAEDCDKKISELQLEPSFFIPNSSTYDNEEIVFPSFIPQSPKAQKTTTINEITP
jgi:tetratricopeptide (TPR) repeat protein